jgi:hypothetical protein
MSIKRKAIVTTFFIFISILVQAADISFVLYYVKGQVTKNSKTKIKKGDKILANESLVLGENSSVILICSNFKAIQLNKKGRYSATSLLEQCNDKGASYSSSYFKYVWNEFTHAHGKPEANPEEYMKNVGAVSRGCNMVQTSIAADTIHISSGALPIYWNSTFSAPILAIYDVTVDGAPLQKTMLKKEQPFDLAAVTGSLLPGEYYWQIIDAEGNSCERNFLKIWDSTSYQQQVTELLTHVPVTTPAETAFAKGFVLHENHFIAEAIRYYAMAAKLAPANKLYKQTLSTFYAVPR